MTIVSINKKPPFLKSRMFYVLCACGGAIAVLLLIMLIWTCAICCCKRKTTENRIQDANDNDATRENINDPKNQKKRGTHDAEAKQ